MSNNYFNRARTARNRIEDTEDVIELVDNSKHIYYVRTNQHEYLVDLSFSATTNDAGDFDRDLYEMRSPEYDQMSAVDMSYLNVVLPHLRSNYPIGNTNLDLIPPVEDYNENQTPPRRLILNPYAVTTSDRSQYKYITDMDLQDTFGKLGWNEFRDFDHNNIINSRYIDHYNIWRSEGNTSPNQVKTPFTYCNELTTYGLSWGLPNIEVLSNLLWGSNKLSNRIINHYYNGDTSKLQTHHIVFGIFTQHVLRVRVQSDVWRPSLVQMAVSLNRLQNNPIDTNISCLRTNLDDSTVRQAFDISSLIPNNVSSTNIPSALLVINDIRSRVGIRMNTSGSGDDVEKDLPMLIIPTAIIR